MKKCKTILIVYVLVLSAIVITGLILAGRNFVNWNTKEDVKETAQIHNVSTAKTSKTQTLDVLRPGKGD